VLEQHPPQWCQHGMYRMTHHSTHVNRHALMYMPRLVTLNPPIYIFLSELNTREAINNQVLLTHQYNVTCRDFRNVGKVVSERETFALAYGSRYLNPVPCQPMSAHPRLSNGPEAALPHSRKWNPPPPRDAGRREQSRLHDK